MSVSPVKFLRTNILNITDQDWWSDGINPGLWDGYAFKWVVDSTIETQSHGSDQTPDPFMYSAKDVKVGDWFADSTGRTFRISEVISSTYAGASFVIEDVDQFNTYNDTSGSGFGGPQTFDGFVFTLSENGTPDLQNMPLYTYSPEIFSNINSRFVSKNIVSEFITFYQSNAGFALGDFIKVDAENEGRFELCAADEINMAVGIINGVNIPKTDSYTFKPLTEVIDNVEPPLVGNYGDIFYMDPTNPGKVTNVKPLRDAKPVYIRLETDHRAVRLNAIVDEQGSTEKSITVTPEDDQVEFTLPDDAIEVLIMSINGIETKAFTFDIETKVLTFDPDATGYGVDNQDEVLFIYQSN